MPFPGHNHAHGWAGGDPWQSPWWDAQIEARRAGRRSSAKFRLWFPVFLSLVVQIPGVFFDWNVGRRPTVVSWDSPQQFALTLGIALVGPLALIGARRFPGPVVAVIAVAASADLLLAGPHDGPPYIAFAFAIGSAIVRGARYWAWAAIAVSWVGTVVLAFTLDIATQPWRVVGIILGILVVVALAEGIRTRGERFEAVTARMAARRQSEVQAERVRIARELHDVLAHSLSQINVQAGVGLHLLEKQPEKAKDALASIKETSKTALDEVRSVLGVLRSDDADAPLLPEPDLSRLVGLTASVSAQGVEVQLRNELGEVAKPIQLALYRIVQESLTNVIRHASASSVRVELVETPTGYEATIRDNGLGATSSEVSSETGGRGLLGMHERAELLGGTLEAGPVPGGFQVRATIPKGSA